MPLHVKTFDDCKRLKKDHISLNIVYFCHMRRNFKFVKVLSCLLNKILINLKIPNYIQVARKFKFQNFHKNNQKLFNLTFKLVYRSRKTHLPKRNMNFARQINYLFFFPIK